MLIELLIIYTHKTVDYNNVNILVFVLVVIRDFPINLLNL